MRAATLPLTEITPDPRGQDSPAPGSKETLFRYLFSRAFVEVLEGIGGTLLLATY